MSILTLGSKKEKKENFQSMKEKKKRKGNFQSKRCSKEKVGNNEEKKEEIRKGPTKQKALSVRNRTTRAKQEEPAKHAIQQKQHALSERSPLSVRSIGTERGRAR